MFIYLSAVHQKRPVVIRNSFLILLNHSTNSFTIIRYSPLKTTLIYQHKKIHCHLEKVERFPAIHCLQAGSSAHNRVISSKRNQLPSPNAKMWLAFGTHLTSLNNNSQFQNQSFEIWHTQILNDIYFSIPRANTGLGVPDRDELTRSRKQFIRRKFNGDYRQYLKLQFFAISVHTNYLNLIFPFKLLYARWTRNNTNPLIEVARVKPTTKTLQWKLKK